MRFSGLANRRTGRELPSFSVATMPTRLMVIDLVGRVCPGWPQAGRGRGDLGPRAGAPGAGAPGAGPAGFPIPPALQQAQCAKGGDTAARAEPLPRSAGVRSRVRNYRGPPAVEPGRTPLTSTSPARTQLHGEGPSPRTAAARHRQGQGGGGHNWRKPSIDVHRVRDLRASGMGGTELAKTLGISRASVSRLL